uniref:Uncharacterized protein n=1 Tax=Laticauda laticaudata TaxID=8630 RepID=A0A8C5S086_LATLA
MDMGKISEYLPDAATCTLCMRVLHDPVTLNCGHNYCHTCIQKHWGGAQSNVACPQCHQRFDRVTLTANRQLGNKPNRGLCEAHKELLTVFCQNDQALLCAECQKSQDHTDHTLASLEGAAQVAKVGRVSSDGLGFVFVFLKKMMDRENQKFSSGYKEMYEVVKTVQQDQMMAAKWINEEIEQELGSLARNHSAVRAFTKGLERKFEEPAYEFLKVGSLQEAGGVPMWEVGCKAGHSTDAASLQEQGLKAVEVSKQKLLDLVMRFGSRSLGGRGCQISDTGVRPPFEANVTMDRLTAHPHLLLSASKKIVTHDATPSGLLPGRQAFDTTPCILAEKGFTAGRHCWQVEVASSGRGWAFGVMKDSVSRKGPVGVSTDEGIWALLPEHLPPAQPEPGPCRFRLYLDYEGGTVHFFDGATREPVALLSYAVFLGERIFPFFKLEEPNSQMRLVP